jgi:hypothetical protein
MPRIIRQQGARPERHRLGIPSATSLEIHVSATDKAELTNAMAAHGEMDQHHRHKSGSRGFPIVVGTDQNRRDRE